MDGNVRSSPSRRQRNSILGRVERVCWSVVTCVPLVIVYGLTTWAVFVLVSTSLLWAKTSSFGYVFFFVGVAEYCLLNWSYTVTVFTGPGSTITSSRSARNIEAGYSHVPTEEANGNRDFDSMTVKSTGEARFCKKCQARKPDRAHHCSTCRQCVLKMDHHCPWIATCVGFRNYKPFLLFCSYTTAFCWTCFAISASSVAQSLSVTSGSAVVLSVNTIILSILSGIIGLVMTGFTFWHISLAVRNQTTIECLEKIRYKTPIRHGFEVAATNLGPEAQGQESGLRQYGRRVLEAHANAIPGVTRHEEGTGRESPPHGRPMTATQSLRRNYGDIEQERERQRYRDYLAERASEKLPNAFDLGWRRNLADIFGNERYLWLVPICNSRGDGRTWEANPKWLEAQETMRRTRRDEQTQYDLNAPSSQGYTPEGDRWRPGSGASDAFSMNTVRFDRRTGEDDTASVDGLYSRDDDERDDIS